jgi:hypothetical protein
MALDVASLLGPELTDVATAVGLADSGGDLNTSWFDNPLSKNGGLASMLTDATQRAALFNLLDQIVPPVTVPGAGGTAKWHPLLPSDGPGNIYVTVDETVTPTVVGVGASYSATTDPKVSAIATLPVLTAGSSINMIAGSASAPLTASLVVDVSSVTKLLSSIAADVSVSTAGGALNVTLGGVSLDGEPPHDVTLGPNGLGGEAAELLVGLLRTELDNLSGPTGEAAALVANLFPLLGFGTSLPTFPITTLASDPHALSNWLQSLTAGDSPPIVTWLGYLAGLLGAPKPPTTLPAPSPWSLPLFSSSGVSFGLNFSRTVAADGVTPLFGLGLEASLAASSNPIGKLEIDATLVEFPLVGAGSPLIFPSASVSAVAPAGGTPLVAPGGAFSIDSVSGGLTWNGASLVPSLELHNVHIGGQPYPVIDLTDAKSIVAAAASAVATQLESALGGSADGAHLLALAGLTAPAAAPTAQTVQLPLLVSSPLHAVATLYRDSLATGTPSWSAYFDELLGLLGLPVATGTGTPSDPWVSTIDAASPLTIQLAAWNAQTSGNAADPQLLRVGMRVQVAAPPVSGWWTSELVAVDLPAQGAASVRVLSGHSASIEIVPGTVEAVAGVAFGADSVTLTAELVAGSAPTVGLEVKNLVVDMPEANVTVPSLAYPFPAGFDITSPSALGISTAELQSLVLGLLLRELTNALGGGGMAIGALFGLSASLPGLQADFPKLGAISWSDPLSTLKAWFLELASGLSSDGSSFVSSFIGWLYGLLAGVLPTDTSSMPDLSGLEGSGTYPDPWSLPIGGSGVAALLWLDPDGPPVSLTTSAAFFSAPSDFDGLVKQLVAATPLVPALPDGLDADALSGGLSSLSDHLNTTDGVVPTTSQTPTGASWSSGTAVPAAHAEQPGDTSARSQVTAQLDSWAAAGSRAVLLLGPAFSDHQIWSALLADVEAAHPGTTNVAATFDFRLPGVPPTSVDLRSVTRSVDFYTADLSDDGTGNTASLLTQIGLALDQVASVRPSVPLFLVAHSTAGLAACAYTAANPTRVAGLITIGTPFTGAPITPLTDAATAEALHWYADQLPGGLPAGPLNDALTTLLHALDGYLPPAAAGQLPIAWPFPVGDFNGAPSTDTGGVKALAIPGQLGGAGGVDLLSALGTAIAGQIGGATSAPPTVVGLGLRADIDLGATSTVSVDGSLRLDLLEIPLQTNAASTHAVPALTAGAKVFTPGGWLAGGPLSYAGVGVPGVDVRVRSLDFGLAVSLSKGTPSGAVTATLHDAAFHGPTTGAVAWGDPLLEAALGAAFRALSTSAPPPSSALGTLLAFLEALGVVVPDPHGGLAVSNDALTALQSEPLAYLGGKFSSAFASGGLLGLPAPTSPYHLPLSGTGVDVSVDISPPTVGAATPAGSPLTLANGVTLGFSAALDVATLAPTASVTIGVGPATLTWTPTSLSFGVEGVLSPLQLVPPPPAAAAETAFADAVLNLFVSTAGSGLLSSLAGPDVAVGGLMSFLSAPGAWLVGPNGFGTSGGTLDPTKLNALLERIGTALGQPPTTGLTLPGGLALSAGSSAGPPPATTIDLATTASIGGVLGIELGVAVDSARHVVPSGTVTVDVGALAGGTWGSLKVGLGATASGFTLTVTPGAGSPIELLPTFGGAGALAGTAAALLPEALTQLGQAVTIPPVVLDLAEALGLYDSGTSAWNTTALQQMLSPGWFASLSNPSSVLTTLANALNTPALGLPVEVAASGTSLSVTYPKTGPPPSPLLSSTKLTVTAGWDANGPTILFGVTGFGLDQAPVEVTLSAGWALGQFALDGFVGVDLSSIIGTGSTPMTPGLSFAVVDDKPVLSLQPLGAGPPPPLSVELAPTFTAPNLTPSELETVALGLLENWALPLLVDLVAGFFQSELSNPIGSTTPGDLLVDAGLLSKSGGKYQLASPLPSIADLPGKIVKAVAAITWPKIALTSQLSLELGSYTLGPSTLAGLTLKGTLTLTDGDPTVSLLLGAPLDGAPSSWVDPGVGLYLFDTSTFSFAPVLHVMGLGVGLAGSGDDALLSTSFVRIHGVDAYVAFDVDFTKPEVTGGGGGLEIVQFGLPLGALDGTSSGNPVASSLLGSTGSSSGDPTSAMPGVDLSVYYLENDLTVTFAGGQPLVLPIHQSFGPLYIDQIDLSTPDPTKVEIGVDASVQIAGLQVDLDDLSLTVPIKTPGDLSSWALDLQGLAVSYSESPVEISGGLLKVQGPTGIEYDGMLSVNVEEFGLTAVGSYARPSDTQGSYTSVFIFVTVMVPLGGPPFLFVTGLAGGFGYNREIHVPTKVTDIPTFTLVEAMNDDSLANDPMSALTQMGTSMPPKRGAFWIAAGVDFTSFALVNSTAIVVIALDRGFEIDVIGVSRMALPTEDEALVSVELALLARYNSAEGVLSVQAQLTDNSYLFSRDCQLTGGFAFFIWFPQGQFVLTLGGYNPVFVKPAQFPDVPRLGFNWDLDSDLVIKGGSYFALTETCVMAGGSLSATLTLGPISAWVDVYLDFLVSWDPFAYEFDVGVEIGVSLSIQVCFFGCVNIGITLSLGASLQIQGPPFHGTASVEAYVTTVTVEFGSPPSTPAYITDWGVFAGKYLTPGDPNQSAVSVQARTGVLAPDPGGAQPQPGTADQPWQVGAEFSFLTTTRMPASQVAFSLSVPLAAPTGINPLDLAPMEITGVTSLHSLTLTPLDPESGTTGDEPDHFTVTAVNGPFPEATWHWLDPQHLPASARTITAVAGLSLDAHVTLPDQSAVIPIGTLTDDEPNFAKPLPFATTSAVVSVLETYGAAADTLQGTIDGVSAGVVESASAAVLSGPGVFADNRSSVGLPASGLSSLGVASLTDRRSAPPLLTSIATGLTMLPVGLAPAHLPVALVPDGPVLLDAPRLKAILRATAAPVVDTSPAMRTSVATAAGVARMAPPSPATVAGSKLVLVPAANAPRPTKAALLTRTVRNGDLGTPIGPGEQATVTAAATDLFAGGVTLGAGVSHLWEVPGAGGTFAATGAGAVRIVFADRAGQVLDDVEFLAPGSRSAPAGAELAVVSCLGMPSTTVAGVVSGFGAVELANAPSGRSPVVGWQTSSELAQIGPSEFLARGASLSLPRPSASARLGQQASYGMVSGGGAVAGQPGVETLLPAGVDVVIVGLDLSDPSVALQGDLSIGVVGATLTTPPVRVLAGDRRVLLYPVATKTADASSIAVSAASAAGWSLAAVAGVRGDANEWAATLSQGLPDQFVPNGPLSPGGSVTVTYTTKEGS